MMTDIMHAHVKGPDLADPTGAKEEQLYVCRSERADQRGAARVRCVPVHGAVVHL